MRGRTGSASGAPAQCGPLSPKLHASTTRRRFLAALAGAGVLGLGLPGTSRGAGDSLRAIVISDLNGSYGSTHYSADIDGAVRRIRELRPDLVISTGDMVAGQRLAPLGRQQVEAMWSAFHRAVSDPLARAGLPLAVTPGNHDASSGARFALEREIFREQWLARRPSLAFVDDRHYPFRYAFAAGPVLFVSLDATRVGPLDDSERQWLAALLERHGERFRYRVVFSHLPLWPFTEGRERDILGDDALERTLQQHRVDLHLSGHHHAYYPARKDGVRFVSQASLGDGPRVLLGGSTRSPRAITVIDFPGDGPIRVEAYRAPDFVETIDRRSLPERVGSDLATLTRDDVAEGAGRRVR